MTYIVPPYHIHVDARVLCRTLQSGEDRDARSRTLVNTATAATTYHY